MLSFLLSTIFSGICFFLLVIECYKIFLNHTKLKAFVNAKGLPIFGNLIELLKYDGEQIFDYPNHLMIKHKVGTEEQVGYSWMGPYLFVYTDSPECYEVILNSDKTLKKAYPYNFLRNSKGIFTSDPSIWKPHRRALNPTLGAKMVNQFLPIFNEKSKKMVDLMKREIGNNVDMHKIMFKSAADSIFSASFNVDWSMQNQRGDTYREIIMDVFERVQLRAHSIWMKPDLVYKFTKFNKMDDVCYRMMHRLIDSALIAKRIDLAEKMEHGYDELANAKETNSFNFIQKCLQLELEQKFDEKDVTDEMLTILVGSTDTTAVTVSATILMLAIHQEYQERVVEELRSMFTGVDDLVTNDHIAKMKFMELVIKESMRLYPTGPYLGRECTEDLQLAGGIIPKGAQVILNIYRSNRSTKYFGENANEFYPERHLTENCSHWHPYQYIPFSSGLRNCPGIRYAWASLKIALAYLLRRYKFTTNLQMHDVRVKAGLILKIVNKDPVRFERREW